ncbi:MAG: L-2-hydroxyglutarate oxidase [Bacteroidota bacterium]
MQFDVTIIGAGIVGLSTAYHLAQQNPSLTICVVDKETSIAAHQTGHNSGVIHSGIYYTPGGSKAINCKKGYRMLLDFCDEHNVRYELCGKVIVATQEEERPLLENIFQRGIQNGLEGIRKISGDEVREIEPYVNAVEGIWVPQSGIISYKEVSAKYAEIFAQKGGTLKLGQGVQNLTKTDGGVRVETSLESWQSTWVVGCAGLYADRISKMVGEDPGMKIVPFRGEYYELIPEKQYLVKNLIYPVPNPNFPFLGVHYTRMINGGIEAGPNAVLAFQREGYSRWDINFSELSETLAYSGFRKVATKFWKTGLGELQRSYSKRAFVKALQHLIPEVGYDDLIRGNAGVRAQAIDPQGGLVDDFLILDHGPLINVCNAPSPAATSSLAIGENVASKVLAKINV